MTTEIMHDERGRAYTLSPPTQYQVEDARPTHFIKDPRAKQYYETHGRWVKLYTHDKASKRYYLPRVAYDQSKQAVWSTLKVIKETAMLVWLEKIKDSLRDYQYEAVRSMLLSYFRWTKGWFVRSWEWTGKTRCMRALTHALNHWVYPITPVVIVVPTLTIQRWIVKSFEELWLNITPVSWGKIEIDPNTSYVMHQKTFLMHYDKLNDWSRYYVQDECHHASQSIIDAINLWRSWVFWFTASPLRWEFKEDGFKMLYWTMYETGKESLPVKVYWIRKERKYTLDYAMRCKWDLPPDSYEIYRNMLNNDSTRMNEIEDIAMSAYKKNQKIIIFCDRIDFADKLYDNLKERCQHTFKITWETSKANIPKQVENLEDFIIVGSIGCCWEWLDIPSLHTWILTFNTSNLKTIRQAAGRVRRNFWSKTHWYFIDIMDIIQIEWSKKYYWWISARKKVYQELWFSLQLL